MSRIILALASASAFCARAAASWALTSPSVCADSVVLLLPTRRLDLARKASTLASASSTFCRMVSISPESHCAGGLGLLFLGLALPHQITVGDGVGDLGGELGILRQKIDVDDARFIDRRHRQAIVIGVEHALFRRHVQRIFDRCRSSRARL